MQIEHVTEFTGLLSVTFGKFFYFIIIRCCRLKWKNAYRHIPGCREGG
jgi:hypothetical protein